MACSLGQNGGGAGPEATGRGLSGVSRRGWCWTLDRLDGEGCSGRTNLSAADHERGVLVEGYLSIVTTLSQTQMDQMPMTLPFLSDPEQQTELREVCAPQRA